MATLITLRSFADNRGTLSVIEEGEIPFQIKRLFYIYDLNEYPRGGHRHKSTLLALICLKGSCKAQVDNGKEVTTYLLNQPNHCLVLEPIDWHLLYDFELGTILLVCASKAFNKDEYIYDKHTDGNTIS